MASSAVKQWVEARLATWSAISTYPFVDENEVAPASPADKYLTVEYPVANEDRKSVGTPGLFRESGSIRFILHIINLSGLDPALADADGLRDLFRDQADGTLETFAASPVAFNAQNRRGAFYMLPFVVTYRYDISR